MYVRYRFAVAFSFVGLLLASCANRQEEAARLEREILNQDTAISLAVTPRDSQRLVETNTPPAPSADAIPPSEDFALTSEIVEQTDSTSESMASTSAIDSVMALVATQTPDSPEAQSTQDIVAKMSSITTASADPMPRREVLGKYTVQIVASISESYALGLVDLYTRRGYEPYVDMKEISGVRWYRVRVGNFDTMEAAEETRDALIDKYSLQAWVDNIPQ
jgi:septal ring-binding cell division protein DamX